MWTNVIGNRLFKWITFVNAIKKFYVIMAFINNNKFKFVLILGYFHKISRKKQLSEF